MSSGGGGTNTVQQTIPDWMQGYISNNYQFGQKVASMSYQPYTGEAVAPLNPMEQSGLSMIQNAGQSGIGMGAVNQGITNATAAGNYTPQQVSYSGPTAGQMQSYMNPYTQNVIDTTMNEINQQNAIANQQEAGSATAAGAFGGAREGVQQALNNKYYGQIAANTAANLNASNFSQAQNEANTVNAGNLTAATANQNAGLTANSQKLQSGVDLGALGQGQQGIALGNGNAVLSAGQVQQQTQQALDQFNYDQYMQQLMWPYQQEQALVGATYGGNVGGTTTSPYYSNNVGSAIGTGLAGAGILSALGASGMTAGIGGGALGLLSLLSDKDAKTDKEPVDAEAIADKVRDLPVDTWRYKPGIGMGDAKHIGTYAQDFAKNFGGDGHTIGLLDAIGVNMAATKGLAQKVARLEKKRAA
ncbi:MAG: tail fiber domain-containing protein [Burkholderia multivorans]|nr:tail fiber domain-containing protein [Burkholderia multivorans]